MKNEKKKNPHLVLAACLTVIVKHSVKNNLLQPLRHTDKPEASLFIYAIIKTPFVL